MNEIALTLPWPPSVNHYKSVGRIVRTKSGALYQQRTDSDKTKRFYFDVSFICREKLGIKQTETYIDSTNGVEVIVGLHPPDKRRRDADNTLKTLLDSLVKAAIIIDDSHILRLVVEKLHPLPPGEVRLTVRKLC